MGLPGDEDPPWQLLHNDERCAEEILVGRSKRNVGDRKPGSVKPSQQRRLTIDIGIATPCHANRGQFQNEGLHERTDAIQHLETKGEPGMTIDHLRQTSNTKSGPKFLDNEALQSFFEGAQARIFGCSRHLSPRGAIAQGLFFIDPSIDRDNTGCQLQSRKVEFKVDRVRSVRESDRSVEISSLEGDP